MPKIPREKLDLAQTILLAIERRLTEEEASWHYVNNYSNCREQGYHIGGGENEVSFSEYRNTDGIVVYTGQRGSFTIPGYLPSDESYEHKKFFAWNDEQGAADYIVTLLKANYKIWQERIANEKEKEAQKA